MKIMFNDFKEMCGGFYFLNGKPIEEWFNKYKEYPSEKEIELDVEDIKELMGTIKTNKLNLFFGQNKVVSIYLKDNIVDIPVVIGFNIHTGDKFVLSAKDFKNEFKELRYEVGDMIDDGLNSIVEEIKHNGYAVTGGFFSFKHGEDVPLPVIKKGCL